ncbi:hypothetical protein [Haloferax volcanii]|uniref:Uncharacterized protein n=3 Tax=Haloferax volcanii TaxID=2246 RepID=D4GQ87_HALVD|nr:hypothetical protein [Haloferax volcanii]ADE01843.1 uncharacterized protein HVO_A0055 [Haloferax volcanii DS2]ELY28656.1 hypothetical protein C498_10976 [Haloferax volcanii DS2]MBS8120978.1 hypothetical protein [Haloferax volcanii]MBS8126015.1 hypothetical protein [Haloferax volcanii]MBS8129868.1 hypothetical protein [Haloferax volcanii]
METLRLSRATYQLIERAIEAREHIGHELERYNDRRERERTESTDVSAGRGDS